MKKWNLQFKKLLLIQHIAIGLITCIGIGFLAVKVSAREGSLTRDTSNYINSGFWNQNPTTGDIFDAIYSGNTAYTRNMSGYTGDTCIKANMNFVEITGGINDQHMIPEIITGNTIYILSGGTYRNINTNIVLSGNCIAIIGRGNPFFAGTFTFLNAKYNVIDNISTNSTTIQTAEYTTQTGSDMIISTNMSNINYFITGDINTGTLTGNFSYNKTINLPIYINQPNNIDISLYNLDNHLNHFTKTIIHDNLQPTLTGNIVGTSSGITEGGIYNTGIQIDISDTNLANITNYGNTLNGTSFVFTTQGLYNIRAFDKAGNNTGINFEIDTTLPTATYTQGYTGQNMIASIMTLGRTTQENTTRILSQKVYIRKTTDPSISGYVEPIPGITSVTFDFNNGQYTRYIVIQDKAGNIFTGDEQTFTFTKTKQIYVSSAQGNYENGIRNINTTVPSILISGNKNFNYIVNSGTTPTVNGNYIGVTKTEVLDYGTNASGQKFVNLRYNTTDNESGYMNSAVIFYIDTFTPNIELLTKGRRQNNLTQILYTWSGSDIGAGISRYNLLINDIMVYSGSLRTYTKTGLVINGVYKAQVVAYDKAGNVGYSTAETTIIDTTPPQIYGVVNNGVYKDIPYPVIMDENGSDPMNIVIIRNGVQIISGSQTSPYFPIIEGGEANYSITATDLAGNSTGVSFKIDTSAPIINLSSPASGAVITNSNTVSFIWAGSDANMSGYDLNIQQTQGGSFSTGIKTTSTSLTVSNLNNGEYSWYVTATDKAGNYTNSSGYKFTINVPFTGSVNLSGTTTINNTLYTKGTVRLNISSNKPAALNITGDIVGDNGYIGSIYRDLTAGTTGINIQLTTGDGQKVIYTTLADRETRLSTGTVNAIYTVFVDTVGPTKPSPTPNLSYTGAASMTWTASTDSGVGVSGYNYIIYEGLNIKKQGTVSISSISINNMELGMSGTYTFKIQAIDGMLNTSDRSDTVSFTYSGIPDISPDSFYFARQYDASLERTYKSTTITVTGLSLNTSIRAIIDEGTLYINGNNSAKEGLVKNGDTVYVELLSSDEYDDITTSTLTIGDKASTFKITTKADPDDEDDDDDNDGDLTDEEIEELENIYDLIKDSDIIIQTKFKEMLEDKIREMEDDGADEDNIDKVRYIYDHLVEDMEDTEDVLFTAPNGKKYNISYESGRGYTSVNFISSGKYFISLDEIKAYINKNNPVNTVRYTIDYSRSSAPYTAPNGKKYYLVKTTTGKYTATNFVIPKLFDTVALVKAHINKNNPR